jgi:hypothetical protein
MTSCIKPKLTPHQVVFIRDCYRVFKILRPGVRPRGMRTALAKRFGVSTFTINAVVRKEKWKHVRDRGIDERHLQQALQMQEETHARRKRRSARKCVTATTSGSSATTA